MLDHDEFPFQIESLSSPRALQNEKHERTVPLLPLVVRSCRRSGGGGSSSSGSTVVLVSFTVYTVPDVLAV